MISSTRRYLGINPEATQAPGGSKKPEDEPRFGFGSTRETGFLVFSFGIAFALALLMLSWMIHILPGDQPQTTEFLKASALLGTGFWVNFGITLAVGFVAGIILSLVYNLLVLQRLNLFGLESSLD